MVCETCTGKLDAYLDGELPSSEAREISEHLRACPGCAAEALSRVQQKRAVQTAGQKFTPDPAFRARIQQSIAPHRARRWNRFWLPALAAAMVLIIAGAISLTLSRERAAEHQLLSELTDLHVAMLASANPVDVVSTDRHTVKPWFAGKIPFTFNLPELQDSPFLLLGGKVSYLHQSPGAELIFRVRQHQISVFIFQDRDLANMRLDDSVRTAVSFNVRTWSENGLRYFAVSDVSSTDLDKLCEMLKAAR